MIDKSFYEKNRPFKFREICNILSIEIPGACSPDVEISELARLDNATESDITFFHHMKYVDELSTTKAFACLIDKKNENLLPRNVIGLIVPDPYHALGILLKEFYSIRTEHVCTKTFISEKASISKTAIIGCGCYISDFAFIDDEVIIKEGTFVGSNVSILRGVEIGKYSHIEPNTTISFSKIGNFAYVKSGARIGQQGFGFHIGKNGIIDIMQIGRVIIGDNVQIGANCTVDRGSMGDTTIGNNARIDDMVHIAHNVEIGDYCVIAAQTGIAGSVTVGIGCVLGGQVGIAGHLSIGDKASIAAQSGVMRDVEAKARVAGSPAINAILWHRQSICLKNLAINGRQEKKD
ncbi:MAG: UDP-3-O-(3-hydroxymyristoyl)glucosamine N-acyltransferase [Holosporales bacterium]|jgi:UDP-3-O-[3-hydroxymyristoyl] glucosamine N-acyltransferase|nr:UDP-3-O-(3-hydroxymyristoyl)glucosamine N-acyltransferase [Holosporales bacterium]